MLHSLSLLGELNDLDFWLSGSSGAAKSDTPKQPPSVAEDTTVEEAGKKRRKKGEKVHRAYSYSASYSSIAIHMHW